MLKKVVKYITEFIRNETGIEDIYYIDRLRFGIETTISEISKLIIIFLISVFINKWVDFFILTALVTIIKVNITCSHCKSYFGCLIKSTTFYLSFYLISQLMPSLNMYVQTIIVFFCLLVINTSKYKNKFQDKLEIKKEIKIKIKITFIYLLFYFISKVIGNIIYTNIVLLFGIYLIYEMKIKGGINYVKGKFQKKGM